MRRKILPKNAISASMFFTSDSKKYQDATPPLVSSSPLISLPSHPQELGEQTENVGEASSTQPGAIWSFYIIFVWQSLLVSRTAVLFFRNNIRNYIQSSCMYLLLAIRLSNNVAICSNLNDNRSLMVNAHFGVFHGPGWFSLSCATIPFVATFTFARAIESKWSQMWSWR